MKQREASHRKNTAVIILNWNRADLTRNLIEQFEAHETNYDIFLVDNCSEREEREKLISFALLRHWQIINEYDFDKTHLECCDGFLVLLDSNYGYAKGNNFGLKLASRCNYEFVLICNNDIVLHQPVLDNLLERLKINSNIGLIGPKVKDLSGRIQGPFAKPTLLNQFLVPLFFPFIWPFRKVVNICIQRNRQKGITFPYRIMGCFMVARTSVLKEVGFFDENTFLYAEELILAEKLRSKGYLTAYDPEVCVRHIHSSSTRSVPKKTLFKMNLESDIYYFKTYRHYGKLSLMLIKMGKQMMQYVWIPLILLIRASVGVIRDFRHSV